MRIDKVLSKVFSLNEKVDAILIKNSNFNPSFLYITGLPEGFYEDAIAIAWRGGKIDVIVSSLDQTEASKKLLFHKVKDGKERIRVLKELLKEANSLGFDGKHMSYLDYKNLKRLFRGKKFYDVSNEIIKARLLKDKEELKNIKKACSIVGKVVVEIPDMLKEGVTEREVANEIVYKMRKYGARREAFETIVAFGKNSAIPHYVCGDKHLRRGDIVLVDLGAVVNNYVSDISRTFLYGKASSIQRKMYEVVLNAQQIAIDSIDEEMTFESLHKLVKSYIDKTEFKNRFIHSTGHTIGIEVHDGFIITEGVKIRFLDSITFTVEPGVYVKGVGGVRIEDDFVFENGKAIFLSAIPHFFEI